MWHRLLAQWEGRERLPVERAHQWAKTEPTDDRCAGEGREPMRERIDECGGRHGADGEHANSRCFRERIAVKDAPA